MGRDSLAIAERLAASDRSNTGWQSDLSVSYDRVGNLLVAESKLDEALKSYRDSVLRPTMMQIVDYVRMRVP